MDFGTLKRKVRQSASLALDDVPDIEDFVNDAYWDLCRDAQIKAQEFTFDLTADVDTYDLDLLLAPSDAGVLRFLSLNVGAAGERVTSIDIVDDLEELAYLRGGNVTPGMPMKATVLGLDTLVLYPIPADAYELSGILVPRPVRMVDDTDEPDVAEQYHRAIYYRATQLAIEWDRQGDADADKFEQRYMQQVGFARRQRKQMGGGRPAALRPSSSPGGRTWPDGPWGSM